MIFRMHPPIIICTRHTPPRPRGQGPQLMQEFLQSPQKFQPCRPIVTSKKIGKLLHQPYFNMIVLVTLSVFLGVTDRKTTWFLHFLLACPKF